MNKLNLVLKILLLLVFALFFSIIGVNKKTIDNYNDKNSLEENIDNLRGIIWANYTFIIISLSIAITIIVSKKYYYTYKWTVLFSIFFILLNTGLVVFEEISIRNYKKVEVEHLNNVYIISSVMNILYFVLFIRLIKITDDITLSFQPSVRDVQQYLRDGPYLNRFRSNYRSPSTVTYEEEPSYFEGLDTDRGSMISDEVVFDEDLGITFRPKMRTSSY
jgi:hypothetical protein